MSVPYSSFVQVASSDNSKVVAGYAFQEKLGSGSFAVVYKGVRTDAQGPPVAIKAITRSSEKLTKKVLQNLEIEISILRTYRHRNIVCLHDVQKTERHFYLVLEYCGGGDVQRLIRSRRAGRLTERLARRLMRDLSAGLKFLWGQELIHRDIKPQNLLLTGPLPLDEMDDPEKTDDLEQKRREANYPSGEFVLKIADFGFARHLQSASLAETLCGSPLYMAPEILQHHRYDAKADLWSVGTVLFEMISGRPPFNGENHIDLLRNIQRQAVRLPHDVKVSKECVNLLRLLLNRNPLSRAGFKEFFDACASFVDLGCNGSATVDEGTCSLPIMDLGTIPENEGPDVNVGSMMTIATTSNNMAVPTHLKTVPVPEIVTAPFGSLVPASDPIAALAKAPVSRYQPHLQPLVPSPPTTGPSPIYSASGVPPPPGSETVSRPVNTSYAPGAELSQPGRRPDAQNSSDENSFVMVEHSSFHRSPATSGVTSADALGGRGLDQPIASSPSFSLRKGNYSGVAAPRGMLGTSPRTGGALIGMLTGRNRLSYDSGGSDAKKVEAQVAAATKMLAAVEDVGRRAINVAHLGDHRAYSAMKLIAEGSVASLNSTTAMEGIEEEDGGGQDVGTVTDESTATEVTVRCRRRSSSATDKSMSDANKAQEEDAEEMPFAMQSESPPLISTGMPTRVSVSFGKGASITMARPSAKPTVSVIRLQFGEALSCYLKGLKMLRGAIGAIQRVENELGAVPSQRLSASQLNGIKQLLKRCGMTQQWLSGQFQGVLERADAANEEIRKLQALELQQPSSESQTVTPKSVEELIYNHSLGFGREGAVKQLLGQYEAARTCYRSAGLLVETLLMESQIENQDRKTLESFVDGFAARIRELDDAIAQQSRLTAGSVASSSGSSRRGLPGIVGLVGQNSPVNRSSPFACK